jgi:hypothetical protein
MHVRKNLLVGVTGRKMKSYLKKALQLPTNTKNPVQKLQTCDIMIHQASKYEIFLKPLGVSCFKDLIKERNIVFDAVTFSVIERFFKRMTLLKSVNSCVTSMLTCSSFTVVSALLRMNFFQDN